MWDESMGRLWFTVHVRKGAKNMFYPAGRRVSLPRHRLELKNANFTLGLSVQSQDGIGSALPWLAGMAYTI